MTVTHKLRNRIVLIFCLFAVFISAIFSFFNFMFIYNIEDLFMAKKLEEETAYIKAYLQRHQTLPAPRYPYITPYKSPADFPPDLKRKYADASDRREFAGEQGRHYHLYVEEDPRLYVVAEVSSQLLVRPIRGNLLTILAALGLSMLVITLLIAHRMASKATAPLSELVSLINHCAPRELPRDFASRFPDNEVGALARSLEEAMRQIDEFIKREQHFTRDASHELRTPIAIVKGATELLSAQDNTASTTALVQRIAAAAEQMTRTVETLLALATADKQQAAAVRLLPLIEQAVVDHAPLIEAKDVTVQVAVPAGLCVYGSESVIAILLNNLISNAFQYTPQGHVDISSGRNQLRIADTGSGIDERIKPDIFSTLVKGSESQGFGIGLSIVKRLCERYGIELQVDSARRGTVVTLSFLPGEPD